MSKLASTRAQWLRRPAQAPRIERAPQGERPSLDPAPHETTALQTSHRRVVKLVISDALTNTCCDAARRLKLSLRQLALSRDANERKAAGGTGRQSRPSSDAARRTSAPPGG